MGSKEVLKRLDNLEAFVNGVLTGIEEKLERIVARGEAVDILKEELQELRKERKDLLNRIMAMDFKTYYASVELGEEEGQEDEVRLQESLEMAGEVFTPEED